MTEVPAGGEPTGETTDEPAEDGEKEPGQAEETRWRVMALSEIAGRPVRVRPRRPTVASNEDDDGTISV